MVSTIGGASERVQGAIYAAARATGVDFHYLLKQASVESGLNPNAAARTSSATGLFQFIDQSWLDTVARHGVQHGLGWAANAIERGEGGRLRVVDPAMRQAILDLRRDPGAASAMAAEFAADNRAKLESRLGHSVEPVDLYLAHFLGAGGATRFLKRFEADPEASAADAFSAAARANHAVFFAANGRPHSFGEIRAKFAMKFEGAATAWPASRWATNAPVRRMDSGDAKPTQNARLAYLMLANLGVAA